MDELSGFLIAAVALTGSPGPNTLSLAAVGAAFGWRRGIGYMAGLCLGMVFVIAIVGTGTISLVFAVPGAAQVIGMVAAAYFIWLAWRIASAPPLSQDAGTGKPPSWVAAIFVSLSNPKAYAAMAATFSGFVLIADNLAADGLVKAALLVAVIIGVNILWLFAGASLTPFLRVPRSSRIINVGFAVALVISVSLALLL